MKWIFYGYLVVADNTKNIIKNCGKIAPSFETNLVHQSRSRLTKKTRKKFNTTVNFFTTAVCFYCVFLLYIVY